MADKQIMIWDTKKPNKKPWQTSQWTFNYYESKNPGRYKIFSEKLPEPIPVEEVGRVVTIPDVVIPKDEAVKKAKKKHPAAKTRKKRGTDSDEITSANRK